MPGTDHTKLSDRDLDDLRKAKAILTSPSLTTRLSDLVGKPLEVGLKRLPKGWDQKLGKATEAALFKALQLSISTMGKSETAQSREWLHKLIVAGAGMAAGAAGLSALFVELPFSTCVMLRSIADIARSEGHDLSRMDIKLACLEVFALGGGPSGGNSVDTGYWAVRNGLTTLLPQAVSYLAGPGLTESATSPIAKFLAKIAARFGSVVSAQAAAIAVPVVGAVSGATINYMFIDHFQDVARAHFTIKRLEAVHGEELIRTTYDELEL